MIKKLKDEVFTKENIRYLPYVFLFCVLLNIIFTENGLIDYTRTKNFIEQKEQELVELRESNNQISLEIKRIETDQNYQKKLIREKLGAISADEYLVLFAEETSPPSTEEEPLP